MAYGSQTSFLSARLLAPYLIERGKDQLIKCPLYQDGALVVPASGTIDLVDPSNVKQVDGAAVTVSGSIAQYTVLAALTSPLSLGEGWRVDWSLTIAGDVHDFRNDAALVRRSLYPVLTDDDLYRRVSALNPSNPAVIHSLTTFQDYRDEAWAEIGGRLIARGNRPNLIMSPNSMRSPHMNLTLALIFDDFSTRLNDAYREHADYYRREYKESFAELDFLYDSSDSGQADSVTTRRAAVPTVWTCGRA